MAQAFDKVRILDFSQVIAGPFAAQMFNMLGATVIKVEQPGSGDQMRGILPLVDDPYPGLSPGFMGYNFGKKSIAINLKAPDAREVIMKLVAQSDVVIENFRAGVIEQLGFGYEAVRAVKPDIVYCSMSGYGQQGPSAKRAAYDAAIPGRVRHDGEHRTPRQGADAGDGVPDRHKHRNHRRLRDRECALPACADRRRTVSRRRHAGHRDHAALDTLRRAT